MGVAEGDTQVTFTLPTATSFSAHEPRSDLNLKLGAPPSGTVAVCHAVDFWSSGMPVVWSPNLRVTSDK